MLLINISKHILGHDDNLKFIRDLKSGYRMEKPEYTPNCVAELMELCWKADSNDRPTFSSIEQTLSSQLESSVTSYYLQLNEEYVKLYLEKMNSVESTKSSWGRKSSNRFPTRPVLPNFYTDNPYPTRSNKRQDRLVFIHVDG